MMPNEALAGELAECPKATYGIVGSRGYAMVPDDLCDRILAAISPVGTNASEMGDAVELITDAAELSAWAHYQPAPCSKNELLLQRKAFLAGYRAAIADETVRLLREARTVLSVILDVAADFTETDRENCAHAAALVARIDATLNGSAQ